MRHPLPSAIASALQTAHGQHAEGKTPQTPFTVRESAQAQLYEVRPTWDDWLAELLAHAAPVLPFLSSTHQELRDAAQRLPGELYELSHREPYPGLAARLVAAAERRFGEPVPGQTLDAQAARVRDPKHWRRFLVRRVREARERLHLQLGLVGKGSRQYCSEGAREHRQMQLAKQDEWLKTTMLRGVIDGKMVEIPLAQVVIDTREDALRGVHRKLRRNEGAQVDVSLIDRTKGSGASYVLKYVLKAVLPELSYAGLAEPLGQNQVANVTPEGKTKKRSATEARKELRSLQSIDAHRSVWRMRSFQMFGIRNCLTLWDELRRIKKTPGEPELKKLWRLARGGEAEGHVLAEEQHGDAYGFLKALGGLAAAVQPEQLELGADAPSKARIYTEPTTTRYGETGQRIKGVELVQPGAEPVVLERVETRSVTWKLVAKDETTEGKAGAAAPGKARTSGHRSPAGTAGDS